MTDRDDEAVALGQVLLGRVIRAKRRAAGFSAEELGAVVGYKKSHMTSLERGEYLPTLDGLFAIANVLGVSVRELLRDVYPWDDTAPPADVRKAQDGRGPWRRRPDADGV